MTQEIIAMAREAYEQDAIKDRPSWKPNPISEEIIKQMTPFFVGFAGMVRNQALEDAAKHFNENTTVLFWGSQAADEINAMKDKHG